MQDSNECPCISSDTSCVLLAFEPISARDRSRANPSLDETRRPHSFCYILEVSPSNKASVPFLRDDDRDWRGLAVPSLKNRQLVVPNLDQYRFKLIDRSPGW